MKLPIVDPLIAEGAGLAARTQEHLLVGLPRKGDPSARTPVGPHEYGDLKKAGIGDPQQFAKSNEKIPLSAFMFWENTIAAAGDVVNGTAELRLEGGLVLHVKPEGGGAPLDLPIQGVPVVAMPTARQRKDPKWHETATAEDVPEPVKPLIEMARWSKTPVRAFALIDRNGMYVGYTLHVGKVLKVDVTGAAGFSFPQELAEEWVMGAKAHEKAIAQLEQDEPSDVIDDFDCRYLASAMASVRYARMRRAQRESGG